MTIPARLAYVWRNGAPRVVPEYAVAAQRYFGEAQGRAWVEHGRTLFPCMARIAVRPEWVGLLDFETRFPSAMAAAMSRAQSGRPACGLKKVTSALSLL